MNDSMSGASAAMAAARVLAALPAMRRLAMADAVPPTSGVPGVKTEGITLVVPSNWRTSQSAASCRAAAAGDGVVGGGTHAATRELAAITRAVTAALRVVRIGTPL